MKKAVVFIALLLLDAPLVYALHGISEAELIARMDATLKQCETSYSNMKGLEFSVYMKTEIASPGTISERDRIRRTKEYSEARLVVEKEFATEPMESFEATCKSLFDGSK